MPSRNKRVSEDPYEVEYILQARLTKARKSKRKEWRYLIKWVGYASLYNSWEPEKNFQEGIMVDQFWKGVELDGRDRTDLSQFKKVGEVFSPTSPPPKTKKRQMAGEDPAGPPRKMRRVN